MQALHPGEQPNGRSTEGADGGGRVPVGLSIIAQAKDRLLGSVVGVLSPGLDRAVVEESAGVAVAESELHNGSAKGSHGCGRITLGSVTHTELTTTVHAPTRDSPVSEDYAVVVVARVEIHHRGAESSHGGGRAALGSVALAKLP